MFLVFLMYALFGSIFSIGKIALAASQPFFLTSVRMLLAGFMITSYLYWKQPNALRTPKGAWTTILLVALFNVFITNAFEFWGLQYMSAGKTCLIYSLSPFAAALIGWFFKTESMSIKQWLGLLVGIFSFLPMMLVPWLEEGIASQEMEIWAEGALVISAVTAVVGWNFVKKLTVDGKMLPASVNGLSFIWAGVMSLMTSLVFEDWQPLPVFQWFDFVWTLLYIVIIHNIICYGIYANSLKHFSVTFMAFAGLSNPLFAAFTGWLFLNEPFTPTFLLAMVGVSIGLWLYYKDEMGAVDKESAAA